MKLSKVLYHVLLLLLLLFLYFCFFTEIFFKIVGVPVASPQPLTPSTLPTLATAPPKIKDVLESVNEWYFDMFQLEKVSEKR